MICIPSEPEAPEIPREFIVRDRDGRPLAHVALGDGDGEPYLSVAAVGPGPDLAAALTLDASGLPCLNLFSGGKLRAAIIVQDGRPAVLGYDETGEVVLMLKPEARKVQNHE
jgi:hypothetical protein